MHSLKSIEDLFETLGNRKAFIAREMTKIHEESFYGDLHGHGKDAIEFYTEKKVITSRWF